MRISTSIAAGALVLALAPTSAWAGSVAASEFGSRANGRAGAMTAVTDDPSAIYFNPANIAFLPGMHAEAGISGIMPRWEWTPISGGEATKSEFGVVTPPFAFLTYNFGDVGAGDLAAGLGFHVPYGSTFSWPEDWAGNQELQELSFSTFELNPVLAWRPGKRIAIGGGVRFVRSQVYLKRAIAFPGMEEEGAVEFGGSGLSLAYNAGISVKPLDNLTFGFSWRSGPKLEFEGDADFETPPEFASAAPDRDAEAFIQTGHILRAGVAVDVSRDLKLSADLERQLWSSYESLTLILKNADGSESVTESPRNSEDSWVIHVGGNYVVSDNLQVRAGYAFDQRTLPEETVNPAPPDSHRHVVDLGASFILGDLGGIRDFGVNMHLTNVFFAKRTTTTARVQGEYAGAFPLDTMAYIVGLSVSGSFDLGSAESQWDRPRTVDAQSASYTIARE